MHMGVKQRSTDVITLREETANNGKKPWEKSLTMEDALLSKHGRSRSGSPTTARKLVSQMHSMDMTHSALMSHKIWSERAHDLAPI